MEKQNLDFNFEQWFDVFVDKCRSLGYQGPIDMGTFIKLSVKTHRL